MAMSMTVELKIRIRNNRGFHIGKCVNEPVKKQLWTRNGTLLDNTRRARVAPKGLLCRVLTNHPAERQDTLVLDNYFQANL